MDLLIEKNNTKARTELKKIIQQHPRYVDYKNRLEEAGISTEKTVISVDAVEQIQKLLKKYDHTVQLQIIDAAYILIANDK